MYLSLYGKSVLYPSIDLFILKNMGAAIIDFRVCPGNITVIKKKNAYQVIYLLSLYLRLQITSQQVLSLNFKPK
jgi:hypothetical protein